MDYHAPFDRGFTHNLSSYEQYGSFNRNELSRLVVATEKKYIEAP